MSKTIIRTGAEAVQLITEESEVVIRYGPDGINASIYLDWGEARELAETILTDFAEIAELDFDEIAESRGRHEGKSWLQSGRGLEGIERFREKI